VNDDALTPFVLIEVPLILSYLKMLPAKSESSDCPQHDGKIHAAT
jgi:hypothetical protein